MKRIKIESNQYNLHHIYITSGDEEHPGCKLSIAAWKWYITIRLPQIVRPHMVKVQAAKQIPIRCLRVITIGCTAL